jgi:hypothetical protein
MVKDFNTQTSLRQDKSWHAIQVWNSFVCTDGTNASPLTLANTNVVTLTIPSDAVEVVLYSNNALKVSIVSPQTSYYELQSSVAEVFPVTWLTSIYIATATAWSIVNFRFIGV